MLVASALLLWLWGPTVPQVACHGVPFRARFWTDVLKSLDPVRSVAVGGGRRFLAVRGRGLLQLLSSAHLLSGAPCGGSLPR